MKIHPKTLIRPLLLLLLLALTFAFVACDGNGATAAPTEDPTLDLSTRDTSGEASEAPTVEPSEGVSTEPSDAPTVEPSEGVSTEPSDAPTVEPTEAPTEKPTAAPTEKPTVAPTAAPTEAPTEKATDAPTEAKTEPTEAKTESATSGASYATESFENTVEITLSDAQIPLGALYDPYAGKQTPSDLVSLYDLCPIVNGTRAYALIDDKVTLSQSAAAALAMLCENAYRETGMRVHLRTADHMQSSDAGYADYESKYSVKIGYYEDVYYAFDQEKARPLADYIRANAYQYGFVDLSVEGDVGHFRYVGVPHAAVMKDYGIKTLAEYHVFLAGQSGVLCVSFSDVNYYIQSFPIAEGAVKLQVPKQYQSRYVLANTGNGSAVMTVTAYASGLGNRLPYVADVGIDRSKTVICLDAGHGAHDPGAVWPQNTTPTYLEKNYNLAAALQAKAYLEAMGYRVILTRDDDTFVELGDRVSFARQYGADLFISFHCNSTVNPDSPTAVGPQVYFNQSDKTEYLNWTIARAFRNAWNEGTAAYIGEGKAHPVEESDLRHGNYAVLSDLALPSVLLEMGFITNEGDRSLMEDEAWIETVGYSVALAVETLFANDQLK